MIKLAEKPKKAAAQKPRPAAPPHKAITVRSMTAEEALKIGRQMDAAGGGPKFLPVTVSLDQQLIDRVDDEAHRLRLTRSAAVRALLTKGLIKP